MSEDESTCRADVAAAAEEERPRDREAQEAHGGSMAPGLVDDTGHPVAQPPPHPPE